MKKLLLFLLTVGFVMTGCSEDPVTEPVGCCTKLIKTDLEQSVVAKPYIVRSGESIGAIIDAHNKKVTGDYSEDMFLADNPHIARRPEKPVKRCDTIAYHSRFIHPGDVLYLREAFCIDTICKPGKSIVWNEPHKSSRIKHVLEPCGDGHLVQHQDITCPGNCPGNAMGTKPIVDPGSGKPRFDPSSDSTFESGFNSASIWLPFLLLALLMIVGFIAVYRRIGTRATPENITEDGNTTRKLVDEQHQTTRHEIKSGNGAIVETLKGINESIRQQTEATQTLVTESQKTTRQMSKDHKDVILQFLENTGENGKKKES